jgi:hypothetical protein
MLAGLRELESKEMNKIVENAAQLAFLDIE